MELNGNVASEILLSESIEKLQHHRTTKYVELEGNCTRTFECSLVYLLVVVNKILFDVYKHNRIVWRVIKN